MRAQGENERPTFLAQVRMDVAGVPSQCGVLLLELESHLLTNDVQKNRQQVDLAVPDLAVRRNTF